MRTLTLCIAVLLFSKAVGQEVLEISSDVVLKAIDRFTAAPLSSSASEYSALIVSYAEDSDDVSVAIDIKLLPWVTEDTAKHHSTLLCAYIAGSTRAQLAPGQHQSPTCEGIASVLDVYRKIQKEDDAYSVKEIESQKRAQDSGELAKYVADSSTEPAATDDPHLEVRFPLRISDFTFHSRHNYEQIGAGYSLRYHLGDVSKIDVYVFNSNADSIPDGPSSQLVKDELATVELAVNHYQKEGVYSDVAKHSGKMPKHNPTFAHSAFEYRQTKKGKNVQFTGVRLSETFVTGYKNHLIKIRLTYPKSDIETVTEIRTQAIDELARLIGAPRQ